MERPYRLLVPDAALLGGELVPGVALAVTLDEGRIAAIGAPSGLAGPLCRETRALPGRVLLPAPVNVHSRAFQVLLRGRADDAPSFRRWVDDHMYGLVLAMDDSALEASMLLAFAEMALNGFSTVGEFFYVHNERAPFAKRGIAYDELAIRCARRVGLRIGLIRTLYDGEGHPGRARFRETVDEAVAHTRALAAAHRGDPLVRVLPAPHSLHAASAPMIRAGHALAHELGTTFHIHLAEQTHDLPFARERYGETPLRALAKLGVVDSRLVIVHGVHLDAEEWAALGAARGGLAYNPSANMFLGDGVTALESAVRAGVTVSLGCDGPGGNNRLDPFLEMRAADLLQRVTQRRMGILAEACPGDPCPPFRMATRNGASLLGFDAGELAVGKLADMIAIDTADPSLLPWKPRTARVLLNNLVHAGATRAVVTDVFVGGEEVVRDRRLTRIDLDEVRAAIDRIAW